MSEETIRELLHIVPSLLWIGVAMAVFLTFREPIRRDLIPRLTGVKAFGVQANFRAQLDAAIQKQPIDVSEDDRSQVMRRASRLIDVLGGARLLWVDDHPSNNFYEVALLASLGVLVQQVTSTADALSALSKHDYDVVVSDMERDGIPDEGTQFVKRARDLHICRSTVIYAAAYEESRGTPPYVLGMTNRPDHLLHFIMDALERDRG